MADTKLISQKQIDKVPVKQKKKQQKKNPINMPNTTYKTKDYLTQQKKKHQEQGWSQVLLKMCWKIYV